MHFLQKILVFQLTIWSDGFSSMVSCQKGPIRHAYAWQIGPFWQDTSSCQWVSIRLGNGLVHSIRQAMLTKLYFSILILHTRCLDTFYFQYVTFGVDCGTSPYLNLTHAYNAIPWRIATDDKWFFCFLIFLYLIWINMPSPSSVCIHKTFTLWGNAWPPCSPNRREGIASTNDDLIHCQIYVSPGASFTNMV